jgi:hypothetical protein
LCCPHKSARFFWWDHATLVFCNLARYKEAHRYLDEARRLSVRFRDKARTGIYDESAAQVFIADGKFKDAEIAARRAAASFEKSGHHCMMAKALITQGVALARSDRTEPTQFVFQQAIQTALQVNALNMAGLATLALIEELDQLSAGILQAAYQQAREWLAESKSPDVLRRLNEAASRVVASLGGELSTEEANEILFIKPFDLQEMMLKHEGILIKRALVQSNGSVTHAASLLGMSYQSLCYVIESRHRSLIKCRTPIRRRGKKPQ